jgi:hypothetical protein
MKNTLYPSLYGQMFYVIFSGLALIFIPNVLLGILGLPPATEIWINLMGLLVLILGFYYYYMAHYGNDKVVWATILGRLSFCAGLVLFVISGKAPVQLIGFALLETGLALWTWKELKTKN